MSLLNNDIIVYWASMNKTFESMDPDPALIDLSDKAKLMDNTKPFLTTDIKTCPAVVHHLKNTFRIKSPIKYDIAWDGRDRFTSTLKDQEFFNKNVMIRDGKTGFLSFGFSGVVFFTEEESLIAEQRQAFLSSDKFCKGISVVEGSFDIGKWFRGLEFAFFINESNKILPIERGDTLYYLKLHTERKIKFRKFLLTPEIKAVLDEIRDGRVHIREDSKLKYTFSKLEKYYQVFQQSRYKKHILKLIKQNILD